jgi:hypothetical protein
MGVISETITGTPHGDMLWEDVAPFASSSQEQVVPAGVTWKIVHFTASAAFLDDTEVRLVWDYEGAGETILALTHGDLNMSMAIDVVGDGVKKLALVLLNDTAATHAVGGCYEAIDNTP